MSKKDGKKTPDRDSPAVLNELSTNQDPAEPEARQMNALWPVLWFVLALAGMLVYGALSG